VLQRVLVVGLLAGLVAGLAVAALQHVTTTPLILAAEVYEKAGHAHDPAPAEEGWRPAEGAQRTGATTLATIGVSVGYALILIAAMLFAGEAITPKTALCFAAGAFAATGLATSLGLAPQLPGMAETALVPRQIWWAGTAALTAAGLFLALRLDAISAKAYGVALILAPHLYGAPHAATPGGSVPAELAARFAASSLAVQAVSWLLAALVVALFWQGYARCEAERSARR
jgi:cobalt transporter subunit CbtA